MDKLKVKIPWIEPLKGIGILLVVAGHVFSGVFREIIFIFHMPLFFFISGYLFEVKENSREYFVDKFFYLLVPYCFYIIILSFPHLVSDVMTSKHVVDALLADIYTIFVGGRGLTGWVGVFWFVTCLFLVQQVMNGLLKYFSMTVVCITMFFSLLISFLNSIYFPDFWLPANANVIFAAAPIFFVGYIAKKINLERLLIPAVILSVAAIYILLLGFNNTYDMKASNYGIPVVTFISALSFTIMIFALSKFMLNFKSTTVLLSNFGSASMVIMFLHVPIQLTLRKIVHVQSGSLIFIIAATAPLIVFLLAKKSSFGRAFLLGSKIDFYRIKNSFNLYKI